ncbi:MAG: hypothetical protein IJG40_12805 [Oscillospiraceae bacterium]|nr:hypothetical protein [Oscillospiraceae bacterium]
MINSHLSVGDNVRLPVEPTGKEFAGTVIYIHPKRCTSGWSISRSSETGSTRATSFTTTA